MLGFASQWFQDHWHGKTRYAPLVIFNVIAVSSFIALAIKFVADKSAFLQIAVLVFPILGITLWQSVGVIRSANRILSRYDGLFLGVGLLSVLAAFHVYNLAQVVTLVSQHQLDPELGKYVPPPARAIQSENGKELSLSGEINYQLLNEFETLLNDEVASIRLHSIGGNIHAARVFAQRIIERGLSTKVDGKCYSACTLIFMAGKNRTLEPDALLGFHAYNYEFSANLSGVSIEDEHQRDIAYFIAQGVAKAFAERIYETDHETLWEPSLQELRDAGVIR